MRRTGKKMAIGVYDQFRFEMLEFCHDLMSEMWEFAELDGKNNQKLEGLLVVARSLKGDYYDLEEVASRKSEEKLLEASKPLRERALEIREEFQTILDGKENDMSVEGSKENLENKGYHKNYGGARQGAGRKKIGESKALRINLPEEDWAIIDKLIAEKKYDSYGDYFRALHNSSAYIVGED